MHKEKISSRAASEMGNLLTKQEVYYIEAHFKDGWFLCTIYSSYLIIVLSHVLIRLLLMSLIERVVLYSSKAILASFLDLNFIRNK